jgi:hypothetical protein
MTTAQVSQLRQSAYRLHAERWHRIREHAYPDTGGNSLFIHNWYHCSRTAQDAEVAGIIANSGEWDAWHHLETLFDRWYAHAEHRAHVGRFSPVWCKVCQSRR